MVRLNEMTYQEQQQVDMYGCTEAQMKEAVEESLISRFSDKGDKHDVNAAAAKVASMIYAAQELMAYGPYDGDTLSNILQDQRQLLNRAKWVLFNYVVTGVNRSTELSNQFMQPKVLIEDLWVEPATKGLR